MKHNLHWNNSIFWKEDQGKYRSQMARYMIIILSSYFNWKKAFSNKLFNRCTEQCYWGTTMPVGINNSWKLKNNQNSLK